MATTLYTQTPTHSLNTITMMAVGYVVYSSKTLMSSLNMLKGIGLDMTNLEKTKEKMSSEKSIMDFKEKMFATGNLSIIDTCYCEFEVVDNDNLILGLTEITLKVHLVTVVSVMTALMIALKDGIVKRFISILLVFSTLGYFTIVVMKMSTIEIIKFIIFLIVEIIIEIGIFNLMKLCILFSVFQIWKSFSKMIKKFVIGLVGLLLNRGKKREKSKRSRR